MALTFGGKAPDRFLQGTAMLPSLARDEAFALLDGVAAHGATSFDLAQNYGYGAAELLVGEWMRTRGRREDLFLVTKGGHPYDGRRRVARDDVDEDLRGSLERLGTDRVELYLLHRDDEDVPVDEVVSFMDDACRSGRIEAYGMSNWRHERIAAARDHARRHDLAEPVASSPHFSLAVPNEPPWPGCVSIAGPEAAEARAHYARERLTVLAWSSLAMGYFAAPKVGAGALDEATERVFGGPENEARRERARAIARRDGDDATSVAFRYALAQPMRLHPIVGCRSAEEYAALRDAAARPLAEDDAAWLESGDATSRTP